MRLCTAYCAKPAYSIASISTLHVGGWQPLPPRHLVNPSCTASSSFKGWAVKHAAIVAASSSNPSRTALALPAAFLLTCILKSLRWPGWPVERARHFTSTSLTYSVNGHTHQSLKMPVQVLILNDREEERGYTLSAAEIMYIRSTRIHYTQHNINSLFCALHTQYRSATHTKNKTTWHHTQSQSHMYTHSWRCTVLCQICAQFHNIIVWTLQSNMDRVLRHTSSSDTNNLHFSKESVKVFSWHYLYFYSMRFP